MKQFHKELYQWYRDHTPIMLALNIILIITLFWSFHYHRTQKELDVVSTVIYKEAYDKFPQVTINELLINRIIKTNPKITYQIAEQYTNWIITYSLENGLDPFLIVGVISTESFWNERLVSSANCIGLMQVNYKVWKKELNQLGITSVEDLYNPEKNIQAGCFILGFYMAKFKGDTIKALQGYLGSQRATWYSERVAKYSIK